MFTTRTLLKTIAATITITIAVLLFLAPIVAFGQTTNLRVARLNTNERYCDQFAGATGQAKIAACLADLPSTGGVVYICSDTTISSGVTLTVGTEKPVIIDLCGRTITMTHTSGVGLTITNGMVGNRTPVIVRNGTINYSGASTNITGIKVADGLYITLENLRINNFNTSGSIAVLWDDVEDSVITQTGFNSNTTAVKFTNNSNQNTIDNCWFQSNGVAWIQQNGSSGNTFSNNLVQSSTGTHPFQILELTADANFNSLNTRVVKNWFEANGDGTVNACQIYAQSDAGRSLQNITIMNNTFTLTGGGASGKHYCFVNSGTFTPPILIGNSYGGGAASFNLTGPVSGTAIGESQTGDIVLTSDLYLKNRTNLTTAQSRVIGVDFASGHVFLDPDNLGVQALNVITNSVGVRTGYPPALPLDVQMSNASLATLAGFTTPAMTDNQKVATVFGRNTSGGNSFYLTYNHNATAASRFIALHPAEGGFSNGLVLAANSDTTANLGINTATPIPERLTVTGNVAINGATSAGTVGYLTIGSSSGFGSGAAGTAVTTTLKGAGTGPTTPQTIVQYIQIRLGTTSYLIPLVQ